MRTLFHPLRRSTIGLFCALVVMLLMLVPIVAAAPATYSGEAPVSSQSEAERAEALKNALAAVVMRISGDSGVLARSDVASAVGDAARYVLQYQYRRDIATDAGGQPQVRLTLVAEFDAVAVDRMLNKLQLSDTPIALDLAPTEHRLWISGVHSAVDYARALGFLTRHSLVRNAQTTAARADGMLVKVSVVGGLENLLAMVGREGTLSVTSAAPPVEGIDATLALVP